MEMLSWPFMQRALAAGLLVGFLASYYGVFVVQRRMSFLGTGLSHAAFGGVALGLLLEVDPLWVALPFTLVVGLGINAVRERTGLAADTAVGIFFAVSVALGVLFLSMRASYGADAFTYLFGSLLAVTPADLWLTGGVAVLALATAPVLWGRWAYATFDRELARSDGLPVRRDDYVLTALLAITIVVAIKVVGILLVAAFLVIPAATARLLTTTFLSMTLASVALGIVGAGAGLVASYVLDIPSGAAIILLQALCFLAATLLRR